MPSVLKAPFLLWFYRIPILALFLLTSRVVLALEDTTGSTNRPSAQPFAEPHFKTQEQSQNFTLPELPKETRNAMELSKLKIKKIQIKGSTIFTEEELAAVARPYEGRDVSIAELEALRLKLTNLYVEPGYANSGAVIPTDAFQDGELTIQIVEGLISEIRVKGNEGLREEYIKSRLLPDSEEPFNINTLQDNYRLLLSDPLVSRMNGKIIPGTGPGQSILDLDIIRARPWHLSLFGNNQRPSSIGAEAFGTTAIVRNLTGFGDTFDFTYITSEGSDRYAGGFSIPFLDAGTLAFFRFDEGDTVVTEEPFNSIDITSQVHSLEGGLSHSFIKTITQSLSVGALLAVRENKTWLLGQPFSFVPGEPTGRNQATVCRIFQDFTQRWDNHALALHSSFNVGLNALDATPPRPVPQVLQRVFTKYPSSEFFSWLGQVQYAWRFFDNGTHFIMRGTAQLSDSPLLPLERIAVGGLNTVRGYRENQLVRDNGYTVTGEFKIPLLTDTTGHNLNLVPFIDYGEAWNYKDESTALFSVGAGVEWQYKPLQAQLYYGHAINNPEPEQNTDLQDSGIHFNARLDLTELMDLYNY